MPGSFLNNVVPWVLQVLIIGTIGAALPMIFRIQHPRSQLIYCHLLLTACLVLPFMQPWHHPVIAAATVQKAVESTGVAYSSATVVLKPQTAPRSLNEIVLWILAAGMVLRLCWILAGLWQLRRYRGEAVPLYPIPQSILTARLLVQADAEFVTTAAGAGPLTFGFFRRLVVVPPSFLQLDQDAQVGIACHELLHVRRNDWLMTLLEELAGSLFWFHPAIWWILAQTRLTREQLVDAEVVHLTSAREPYVNALLSIAGARPKLDLAPAPLFLRKRHLLQRMHFLLTEVPMSRFRLFSSYVSMAAILVLAGGVVFTSFPLIGRAEVRPAIPQQAQTPAPATPATVTDQEPGYVVNRRPNAYPQQAIEKKIEGTVVVELTFNANGDITDSRVLSGPEELRRAGLQSALQGTYNINTARTLQVVVEFKLPTPGQPIFGQRGGPGMRVTITGPNGTSNVIVPPPPPPPAPPPPAPGQAASRIRVGGNVLAANLVSKVDPVYPPMAKQARIQGVVVLEAQISKEGKVENLQVVSGHPLLIQAAIDAVKQWEYTPVQLNGEAMDVVSTITVNFALGQQ
jgi:TonB family protein